MQSYQNEWGLKPRPSRTALVFIDWRRYDWHTEQFDPRIIA